MSGAGNPPSGRRQRIGRDLGAVDWKRVYDLIVRLYPEFQRVGVEAAYRENVNLILAAYGSAWDLGPDGLLHRVLPAAAQAQIIEGLESLRDRAYTSALDLYKAAREAYDARPRRDRDACSNMFDAMEAIAKITLGLPSATFGNCTNELRTRNYFTPDIIAILERINALRNHCFGHGMTTPFVLTPPEVDFAYLSCVGGIILFART